MSLPDLGILRRNWPGFEDPARTRVVRVGGVVLGGPRPVMAAGPCAVESYAQALAVARAVREAGGDMLRGGAFKPRTNPHSFQGLGREGLRILSQVGRETGLPVVTEALDPRHVELVAAHADMIQVGSRSMQNFPLLTEVGRAGKPVLLKRGWAATLEEWLCAAEYVLLAGNADIVFCERGVRTGCQGGYAASVLDLNVLQPLRAATPLPVIVDPSHAAGHWTRVAALSRAALAAGAHGLLVEVVEEGADRTRLRSDAEQGVPPGVLREIVAARVTA
ncbi:MAG TPA: 3-deoxy-7-phosphoheptulonate synthase [Candidatus Polarisedimenticolaceae bacterium]|nr:3-deoxy-7-phosphoheptulonate synthase [Candidatus Polarisedimenticolaceae bacterium]